MEFFVKTKAVKLKSHLDKYLVAGEDQAAVRQSRNGAARKARWLVELVDTNPHVVRLKSCYNRYLAASGEPYLLCMTGRRVLQTLPENHAKDLSIEWQPIRDGFQVKLKASDGTYLRANGGTPPWRNTVTHDCPHAAATHDWVVWDVEAVEVPEDEAVADYWSMVWSFSSISDEIAGLDIGPLSTRSSFSGSPSPSPSPRWLSAKKSPFLSLSRTTAMDIFQTAKAVRLKSIHGKYLTADDNEESVTLHRTGNSKSAKWTVELVESSDTIVRLRSCYGKYLTASTQPFLLGLTGRRVVQTQPSRVDSSVEWEPIRESGGVKLKTRYGHYLRANLGLPPWRNSVTHDIPHHAATQDWILWEIHVVEILDDHHHEEAAPPPATAAEAALDLVPYESSSPSSSHRSSKSASLSGHESHDSLVTWSPKVSEGRVIYFHVANEFGELDEEFYIRFKGNKVSELTKKLKTELGVEAVTVCSRSPLDGKLYPLRLHLPPNNATMHLVVLTS
ncbi:uncharacterized protein LOC127263363 [Andrographis paniculata]|uniref:uncharacterized protein LOC127263363 n=1 Tax=Andrographis paniculata TaxID=175694 RepID=UPI0021E937E5|nr:uncharacterized protein LOC127263363 [Andrographis paniculata]